MRRQSGGMGGGEGGNVGEGKSAETDGALLLLTVCPTPTHPVAQQQKQDNDTLDSHKLFAQLL